MGSPCFYMINEADKGPAAAWSPFFGLRAVRTELWACSGTFCLRVLQPNHEALRFRVSRSSPTKPEGSYMYGQGVAHFKVDVDANTREGIKLTLRKLLQREYSLSVHGS